MTQSYQEIKCSYIVCVAKGIGSLTTCKDKGKSTFLSNALCREVSSGESIPFATLIFFNCRLR